MTTREPDDRWLRRRASLLADLARNDPRRAARVRLATRAALLAAVERAGRGRH